MTVELTIEQVRREVDRIMSQRVTLLCHPDVADKLRQAIDEHAPELRHRVDVVAGRHVERRDEVYVLDMAEGGTIGWSIPRTPPFAPPGSTWVET